MGTRLWVGGLMLAGAVLLAGCAAAPKPEAAAPLPPAKALQPADLASLAGEWVGTIRGKPLTAAPSFSADARVTLAPSGSYTGNIDGKPATGQASIAGGKVVFAGTILKGTATLHEGSGRRVLVGEGQLVGRQGEATFELTRR